MKLAIAPVALVLLLLSPTAAPALEPSRASDLVTLIASETDCPIAGKAFDTRVLADGSQVPFTIPPKRVLVITGFEFLQSGAPPGAGTTALVTQQPTGAALASPLLQAAAVADAGGFLAGSAFAAPGIAVRGTAALCGSNVVGAILHGFLAKDK